MLGCGNAKFSEDLYDTGFKNIYNVDISSVVIKQMMVRNKQRIKMQYETMDVINLKYDDNFYYELSIQNFYYLFQTIDNYI